MLKYFSVPKIFIIITLQCLLLLLFSISCQPAHAEAENIWVDVAPHGGVGVIELDYSSFGTKLAPLMGASLCSYFQLGNSLMLNLEGTYSFTFRSNYEDYYYYDSFHSFSIASQLGYIFTHGNLRLGAYAGGGFSFSGSRYFDSVYGLVTAGAGVHVRSRYLDGIWVYYVHNFHRQLRKFELFKAYISFRLWSENPVE